MSAVVDPMYRPLGLETDMNNPNFAGPRNPDDLLWVEFSMRAIHNPYKSEQQGRPIFDDQLWVEIRVPGNNLLTIETPALDEHKRRFPRQWAYFQQTHAADGQNSGTPLAQWPILRPSQIEELRALKFYTVENIAFASDEHISRVGMLAGMAPLAFRERAKLYLETAQNSAMVFQNEDQIKRRDAEIAALKAQQAESERKHAEEMAELRQLIQQATTPRRGGWPKGKPRNAPTGTTDG